MQDKTKQPGQREATEKKVNNKNLQGNDKAPGEEIGKGEKVTNEDLKGKQVDEDPSSEEGKPLSH